MLIKLKLFYNYWEYDVNNFGNGDVRGDVVLITDWPADIKSSL